jgi:DNA-binding transcriptional MerR regulator
MNNNLEQLMVELKNLGFTQENIEKILNLATEEALDLAIGDLENLSDQDLEALANELDKPINSVDDSKIAADHIFTKAYGTEAENKKIEYLTKYLENVIEETKKSKDLLTRYQQGDPTAVATLESNKDNPDVQAVRDEMQRQTQ